MLNVCQKPTTKEIGLFTTPSLIRQRQREGIEAAKKAGKHLGRPAKLSDQEKAEIIRKHQEGINPTKLSQEYGISRGTIYNVVKINTADKKAGNIN